MQVIRILPGQHAAAPLASRPRAEQKIARRESDGQYFARRAAEERAYAAQLKDSQARLLHLEMADRYRQLSAAIQEADDRLG